MHVINQLSWRNLRDGTNRTVMTIIAMAIAATLMVATFVGMRSTQTSMMNYETRDTAGYLAAFPETSAKQARQLQAMPALGKTAVYVNEGLAKAPGLKPGPYDEPYTMAAIQQRDFTRLMSGLLDGGRLPKRGNEVLISSALVGRHYVVGDKVTLTTANGTARYRVVGSIGRYSGSNMMPTDGFVRLVKTLPAGKRVVLTQPKNRHRTRTTVKEAAKAVGLSTQDVALRFNDNALVYVGDTGQHATDVSLLSVFLIALTGIALVAVILIYASLNLTVQAQRQRYGLLRSLGATPTQVRGLVFRQAFWLAIPALILGYGAGIGGLVVVFHYLQGIFVRQFVTLKLSLVIDVWPLVGAGLLMLVTTLLAAMRPAWRASRVTPMAAIRDLAPSPRIRQRRLRETWLMRHVRQPLLKQGLKFDRRSTHRTMLTLILTGTVALFIGLTGFFGSVWRNAAPETTADMVVTSLDRQPGDTSVRAIKQTAKQEDALKSYEFAQQTRFDIVRGAGELNNTSMLITILPDAEFKQQFDGRLTLLNGKQTVVSSQTKSTRAWAIDPSPAERTITFAGASKANRLTAKVRVVPMTKHKTYGHFADADQTLMVMGRTQYAQWHSKLKHDDANPISTTVRFKLKDQTHHLAVASALRSGVETLAVIDMVAENQKAAAVTTAMSLAVYGFIALLSLVCLATIVNSTFATLLARRNSLAMLQSVGTTPMQATMIVQIQHGLLFLRGWCLGSLIGIGVAAGLYRVMNIGYAGIAMRLPWVEVGISFAVLFLVWLLFGFATHRLLAHQDIEQRLRII